ncbi:MAG: O-antigen ligase family protein [Calothrix sp. MO_192.B10]|nr:O-antigen ligase family protein [Calothrix sp. MO_192.B10]
MIDNKLPFQLGAYFPSLKFCWHCIQLGLLILPLLPSVGAIFIGVALIFTWLQNYHTIIRHPLNWGFVLLSLLLIISASFAFDKTEAFLGLFNFLPFFLAFAGFSSLIQKPCQLRRISWILVITSVPVVVMGWGQLFWGWTTPPLWESIFGWTIAPGGNPPGRMASVFMYANTLAVYLVIVFVLGLGLWLQGYQQLRTKLLTPLQGNYKGQMKSEGRGKREEGFMFVRGLEDSQTPSVVNDGACIHKAEAFGHSYPLGFLFLGAIAIANFTALILTNSRNAWAIGAIACLVYSIYQGWRILVAGVAGVVATIAVAAFAPSPIAEVFRKFVPAFFWARLNDQMYPDRPLALMRTTQWHFAWDLTWQRPWTGWGLRNFTQLYQDQMDIWLGHPHNLFLMLSSETGLPATILFCGLFAWIAIASIKRLRNQEILKVQDRVILFSYILLLGCLVLLNTFDVSIFDFRMNVLSWVLLSGLAGVIVGHRRGRGAGQNSQG